MPKDKISSQNIHFSSDDFKIYISDKISTITNKAFHSAIEIKLFYEGSAIQIIGSNTIVANAGDITIANPYEIHTNIETDVHNGKYYLIIVELDFFESASSIGSELQDIFTPGGVSFNNHIRQNDRLNKILTRIFREEQEKKKYYKTVIRNLIEEFFLLLLRDELSTYCPELSLEKIKKAKLVSPAITKIFNDFNKTITIDELADLCHTSKYHFCRVFKQVTGQTPTCYIMSRRIHMARALLEDKSKSIKQIAAECGYNDISYFYRCYKKITGASLTR